MSSDKVPEKPASAVPSSDHSTPKEEAGASAEEEYDIVILGGGPAGLMAATYAGRSNRRTAILVGAETSSQLSMSPGVENFPAFPSATPGLELLDLMTEQAEVSGAHIIHAEAKRIELGSRPFVVRHGFTEDSLETIRAKALILCMGASARTLDIPGASEAWGVTASSCALCDAHIVDKKPTVVVGGGDTAIEEALYLCRYTDVIYLVHRRDQLRASGAMCKRLEESGVRVLLESEVEELVGGPHITSVVIRNTKTGSRQEINAHSLFYGIGHIPATEMVNDVLETHHGGFLKLQPGSQMTSLPGVFAAGDIADYISRQAVCAAGQGAAAAIEACRWLETQHE